MPANQNPVVNVAGVRFSSPGVPNPAPAANEPMTKVGPEGSTANPNMDALRGVSGQVAGVAFRNPA